LGKEELHQWGEVCIGDIIKWRDPAPKTTVRGELNGLGQQPDQNRVPLGKGKGGELLRETHLYVGGEPDSPKGGGRDDGKSWGEGGSSKWVWKAPGKNNRGKPEEKTQSGR